MNEAFADLACIDSELRVQGLVQLVDRTLDRRSLSEIH